MSQRGAVRLARDVVKKLGFSPRLFKMERKPRIQTPNILSKDVVVPRIYLEWEEVENHLIWSSVRMEIDADKKQVKHLSLYSAQLWQEADQGRQIKAGEE